MKLPSLVRRVTWKVAVLLDPADALADLFRRHADALFRYAVSLHPRKAAAEDAVQEVFLALAADHEKLWRIVDPVPYLYTSVRHQVLRAAKAAAWAELPEADLFPSPDLPPEERACLLNALQALPEEQREVVFLKDVLRLSYREISEILSIPLNTAASRHRYALTKLRTELEEPDLALAR
jgi:RNA polymerase sigma-70 factor, ECF subfamily